MNKYIQILILLLIPFFLSCQTKDWVREFYKKNGRPPTPQERIEKSKSSDNEYIVPFQTIYNNCTNELDSIATISEEYISFAYIKHNNNNLTFSKERLLYHLNLLYKIDKNRSLMSMIENSLYYRYSQISDRTEDIENFPIMNFIKSNFTKNEILTAIPQVKLYKDCEINFISNININLAFYIFNSSKQHIYKKILLNYITLIEKKKNNKCLIKNLENLSYSFQKEIIIKRTNK